MSAIEASPSENSLISAMTNAGKIYTFLPNMEETQICTSGPWNFAVS
jgi:hypothetical protein